MWNGHERIDQRSMALHRAVAAKLEREPELWRVVRENLARDLTSEQMHPSYAEAWRELLALPWEDLKQRMVEDSENMRALRQCSPFAGVLDNRERWSIFAEYAELRGRRWNT
jgi:hypothetical protein